MLKFEHSKNPFNHEVVVTAHDPDIFFNDTFAVNLFDVDFEKSVKLGVMMMRRNHKNYLSVHAPDTVTKMQWLKQALEDADKGI